MTHTYSGGRFPSAHTGACFSTPPCFYTTVLLYHPVSIHCASLPTRPSLPTGFKNIGALKKALLDNIRDSAIWGLTYLYVRRLLNPEFRAKTHTFVQDGYFGALSSFCTTLIKQVRISKTYIAEKGMLMYVLPYIV